MCPKKGYVHTHNTNANSGRPRDPFPRHLGADLALREHARGDGEVERPQPVEQRDEALGLGAAERMSSRGGSVANYIVRTQNYPLAKILNYPAAAGRPKAGHLSSGEAIALSTAAITLALNNFSFSAARRLRRFGRSRSSLSMAANAAAACAYRSKFSPSFRSAASLAQAAN